MTATNENRTAENGAKIEAFAELNTSDSTSATPIVVQSRLIGHTVEKALDASLWRLRQDEITLDDCTPALRGWYLEGHRVALESVLPELTRVEQERDQAVADRDRLYRLAYDRPGDQRQRMRSADEGYWQQVVDGQVQL